MTSWDHSGFIPRAMGSHRHRKQGGVISQLGHEEGNCERKEFSLWLTLEERRPMLKEGNRLEDIFVAIRGRDVRPWIERELWNRKEKVIIGHPTRDPESLRKRQYMTLTFKLNKIFVSTVSLYILWQCSKSFGQASTSLKIEFILDHAHLNGNSRGTCWGYIWREPLACRQQTSSGFRFLLLLGVWLGTSVTSLLSVCVAFSLNGDLKIPTSECSFKNSDR